MNETRLKTEVGLAIGYLDQATKATQARQVIFYLRQAMARILDAIGAALQ